jgi:hypothetical protein
MQPATRCVACVACAAASLVALLACNAARTGTTDSSAANPGGAAPPPQASAPAADTAAPVTLRTDASRYAPGARVGLTIVSRSDARYAFNPCPRRLEQEAGGAWRAVEEAARMCTMEAWILEPRATRTATTELPSPLAAGRYRVVIELTREGATPPARGAHAVTAVSAPFDVAP